VAANVWEQRLPPPTVDKKILPDETRVSYWYKCPCSLLMHQINEIISLDDLVGLEKVHIVTGGDHGGGCLQMIFKILLRYHAKECISKINEIANAAHLSYNIEILKDTA